MTVAVPKLDVAGWAPGPAICGWLDWPSQKLFPKIDVAGWASGASEYSAQPKVAAKIKKWLHTCVQRVGVSRTLHSDFATKSSGEFGAASLAQHFVTSFPINFTSMAVPTVPYTHPDHAPLKVLSGLLSAKYLHSEIREKGGAYGGGAMAGPGAFTYYSYRDPNNLETFSVYNASTDWVLGEAVGQAEVDEALLRVFQGVDAPVAPGYRGLRPFLSGGKLKYKTNPELKFKQILPGITDADFAEHRSRLRAVKVTDVKDVAER